MGKEKADAVRTELRYRVLRAYGSLQDAAPALGIPYKTLYRALTEKGKDRTETVDMEFVIAIVDHLHSRFGGDDFPTFYAYATRDVD